ncbi:MAG: acylphosphatase [Acidobacteriota bacterium]
MKARASIVVRGLVQGVGFRYFVLRKALGLGLFGYARNLVDGSVEVEAEGEREMVESLIGQLRVGPRSAAVSDVEVTWREYQGTYASFDIG